MAVSCRIRYKLPDYMDLETAISLVIRKVLKSLKKNTKPGLSTALILHNWSYAVQISPTGAPTASMIII